MPELAFHTAGTIADLHTLESNILAALRQALGQSAALAAALARSTTKFHDRTGQLRASVRRGQTGPWALFVKAGDRSASYAGIVEDGSGAHEIRPKRTGSVSSRRGAGRSMAPVLRFMVAGQWRSARVVHHPGTKPTHFMLDARDQAETALVRFTEAGIGRAIAG